MQAPLWFVSDWPEKVAPQLRNGRCFMAFQYCARDGASTQTDWKKGRGKRERGDCDLTDKLT